MPLLSSGNKAPDTPFEDAPFNEYAALAFEAFNPDIGAEPDHLPLIAAAGVLFLEAYHVPHLYFQDHLSGSEVKLSGQGGEIIVNLIP